MTRYYIDYYLRHETMKREPEAADFPICDEHKIIGYASGEDEAKACVEALNKMESNKKMIDPTDEEKHLLETASRNGGEYLESIGKTDLAQMTKTEWMTFIEAVVTGYYETHDREMDGYLPNCDAPF